jgi:hypothetical protein
MSKLTSTKLSIGRDNLPSLSSLFALKYDNRKAIKLHKIVPGLVGRACFLGNPRATLKTHF